MSEDLEDLIERANRGEFTPTGQMHKDVIDLTGQTFGRLTVIQRLPNNRYSTRWLCECTCGTRKSVMGGNLIRGGSKSCGCTHRGRGAASASWRGYGGLPGRYWSILVNNAERRGHVVGMTIKQAWELYERQEGRCALTGWGLVIDAPIQADITASLDRIDSLQGYVTGNTQWVHKDVNIAKNVYAQKYFIHMCRSVASQASV